VMFVGAPRDVAVLALTLSERAAVDPLVPDVRIGVACGSVLARDGDYYGPVVNLASRITDRARRGTVLASEPLHRVLVDDPELSWRPLGSKRLRGIGKAEVFVLRRVR
jgi:adenylate cyclase